MILRKWTFLTLGSGKTRGKGAARVSLEPHPEEGEGFTGLVYWGGQDLGCFSTGKNPTLLSPYKVPGATLRTVLGVWLYHLPVQRRRLKFRGAASGRDSW